MAHRLQSVTLGACRRLGRRAGPSLMGGARMGSSATSAAPLQLAPSRVRPAAVMASSNYSDISSLGQRRHFHQTIIARDDKGDAAAAANTETAPFTSPKVEELFNKIIYLDLVEVHLLAEMINEKLGVTISDAERERMARGGGGGGGQKKAAEDDAPAAEEKTAFDVKLTGFDAKAKIKVIKEVRGMTSLGLKEAKELVEGAPSTVKKDVKKEEAEELKAKLEALGATVEIV
ncbi:hypothetical protein ACHAXT_000321 [Thalassiosira profunda]